MDTIVWSLEQTMEHMWLQLQTNVRIFMYDKLLEIQKAFYFDVLQHAIAIRSIGRVLVSNEK